MRDTREDVNGRTPPGASPRTPPGGSPWAGPADPRRSGPPVPRELMPSSPWLTLEEASRRARLGLRAFKALLRERPPACPGMTCGSGEEVMVRAEALDRLLQREAPPAGGGARRGTPRPGRRQVRAERVDSSCGSLGHMTADEIRRRTLGAEINLACPECGGLHLSPEEAREAAGLRLTGTPRYRRISREAEAGPADEGQEVAPGR